MKAKKKKYPYKIKIIALIIFALTPFISFFVGMKYQEKVDNGKLKTHYASYTKNITQSITPTNVETTIDTSHWKIYVFPNTQVSFKYPPTLFYAKAPGFQQGYDISLFDNGTQAKFTNGDIGGNEEISIYFRNNDKRTLDDFIKNYFPHAKKITISGKPAIEDLYSGYVYYTIKSSLDSQVGIEGKDIQVINQINSTFNFTD